MFWWKYKENRKVSDIDDDSKPEEVGGGGGGGDTLWYNPFTYKWYQMVWLLNPYALNFYSLIPSDLNGISV